MITLTQTERLVRKIGEILGQPALEGQAARLAQDYTAAARAANHRLEQCAVMIEAGDDLQALQLAEAPPPLLDLITMLNFRQAVEWRTYCQSHGLPWAEPFFDKSVRLLNSTYGKGLTTDHPYYSDYRKAVMKNDDERALAILRVIARMNAADQNTVQELRHLEERVLRSKFDGLRQMLESGDTAAVFSRLQEIEGSGLPIPPKHSVWQQAQLLRCEDLLRQAEALRQQEVWQEAELVLQDIQALATQHAVLFPPADQERFTALEEWTGGLRKAFADEQDFQRALTALEYQVGTAEAKRATGAQATLGEWQSDYNSLASKWQEAERFKRPLDEQLLARCQQCCDWLQGRIRAQTRRKRFMAGATSLLVLAVVAVAGLFAWDWLQERDLLVRFKTLQSSRRVGDTEQLLARIPARLKSKPRVSAAAAEAQKFVARERDLKRLFDQKLQALMGLTTPEAGGLLDQVEHRRAECAQALGALAPDFQADGKSNLVALDQRWQSRLGALQPERNAQFSGRLAQAEKISVERLNGTNDSVAVRATLFSVQSLVTELDRLRAQPGSLEEGLTRRFYRLTNQVAFWSQAADQWDQLRAVAPGSFEEYTNWLNRRAQSPFALPDEVEAVKENARLKICQDSLLGPLLMPSQAPAWDSLTNLAAGDPPLKPEQSSAQEKDAYLRLRDDKNLQDVYFYYLTKHPRPDNPLESHAVLAQGKVQNDRYGRNAGRIYDPKKSPSNLRFEQQSIDSWDYIKVEYKGLARECFAFQRLGLGDLLDPNTGGYQKTILELLDRINQDTDSSAIFRAYVSLKLFAVPEQRPLEWGLQWAPSAAKHIQTLKEKRAGELQSGDWLVPSQISMYEEPLKKHFEQARAISFQNEASFFHRLTWQACSKGFAFAGFIDAAGNPVITRTNAIRGEYWGWASRSRSPALLLRRTEGGSNWQKLDEPLRLTPLFIFLGDRGLLLDQTAKATFYPLRSAGAVLPPLFNGL
jgi:hypothetical protein